MDLTDDQKQTVSKWAAEGLGLSDIQKRLEADFGLKMTYMDVRFIVIELGVALRDKQQRRDKKTPDPTAAPPPPSMDLDEDTFEPPSRVRVELDKLQKPGLLVSGSVTFSDGVSAQWGVDQMGRLMLDAGDPNYKPSQDDVAAFQMELQNLLGQRGF
jgi:hypothetical protein